MLFPSRCPLCRRRGPAPCVPCAARLPRAPAGIGPVAGVLLYAGAARRLVTALKYRNRRDVLVSAGAWLAALAPAGGVDVVTWAPTSAHRRRRRGFDQAELLARAVAGRLGVPCRGLLRRAPGDGPQTGRPGAQRRRSPPRFAVVGPVPARVLLVDDVVTTGATVRAAASALEAIGAHVTAVALAVTPKGRPVPAGLP